MIGSRIGTPTNRGLLDARYVNVTGDTMTGNLTMAAESFIGPSSTTGIYFKSGNVGIGTTGPGAKLEVFGNTAAGVQTRTTLLDGITVTSRNDDNSISNAFVAENRYF